MHRDKNSRGEIDYLSPISFAFPAAIRKQRIILCKIARDSLSVSLLRSERGVETDATADGNRLPVPLHAGMSPFRLFLLDHCKFLILVQAMAAQRPSPPPDSAASCPATSSSTDAEIGWLRDGYSNF
jgi:hypothetical protein